MEKTTIRKTEFLFYGFYLLLTIAKGMGLYEGMRLFDGLVCAAFLLLICKLVQERYTWQQLLMTAFMVGLGVITWRMSGKMGGLFNLALLAGLRGINHRRLIRISAVVWGIIFSLQCFLTMSGLRTEQIFRIHRKLGIYIVRWSMGFTHPNVLHITYFILIALLFYTVKPKGKRKLIRYSVLAMAGNLILFCYSVSYTGVLIVTLYLLVNVTLCGKAWQRGVLFSVCRYAVYLLPVLCILFSTGAPILLKGRAFELANKLLSTRLELSRQYILGQGIHLFGSSNMETVDASITVDCSYVYMLVHYGLIYFIFFCVLLEAAVICCWKKQKMDALAILIACTISGVTEQYMANTSFKNIAVLIIAAMFYGNSLWERNEDGDTEEESIHCGVNKKRALLMSLIGFGIGTAFYCITVRMPSAVYASLWDCDRKEGAAGYEYISDTDLLSDPDFDGWILSDRDPQGRLYGFDGLTVTSEYYRRAAGRGFAVVILILWVEGAAAVTRRKNNRNVQQ